MLKSSLSPESPSPEPSSNNPVLASSYSALRQNIRYAYEQCRKSTLSLVQEMEQATLCRQAHPDFSPVGWHLGHIAYTEALWILEHLAGQPPVFPQYHRLFAADGLPKAQRQNLPDADIIYGYLDVVRERVFNYLDTAPVQQQERIWRFLLQHESQHCETMTLVAEILKTDRTQTIVPVDQSSNHRLNNVSDNAIPFLMDTQASSMIHVPDGIFQLGSDEPDALDNERPAHSVHLDEFWIDPYPVTYKNFQVFINAGGYADRQWWSDAGWIWCQKASVEHPLYQTSEFITENHPVCGVSWYEADAYARFVGKRLPTEAEWEKAARWKPATSQTQPYPWGETFPTIDHSNHGHSIGSTSSVTSHLAGTSAVGCIDLLGNVWEWTASLFEEYPGFRPYPYAGYSQTYFDRQHYVLRGGSWATRPWALRPSFRNWYHPWTRQIFAGFRCASSLPPQ